MKIRHGEHEDLKALILSSTARTEMGAAGNFQIYDFMRRHTVKTRYQRSQIISANVWLVMGKQYNTLAHLLLVVHDPTIPQLGPSHKQSRQVVDVRTPLRPNTKN
jgi:hypothetical protein